MSQWILEVPENLGWIIFIPFLSVLGKKGGSGDKISRSWSEKYEGRQILHSVIPLESPQKVILKCSKNLISKMYGCRDIRVLKIRNPGGKVVF